MEALMKIFFTSIILLFSGLIHASEICREINDQAYKNEISLTPTGKIYRATGTGRLYIHHAPDIKCKPKNAKLIINGDKVQAYTQYNDFFSIIYFRKNGATIEGWILKDRLIETKESSSPSEQ
jgi:hypothetical protein